MRFIILFLLFFASTYVHAQTKKDQLRQINFTFVDEDFESVLELSAQLEEKHPEETGHLFYKTIASQLLDREKDISDLLAMDGTKASENEFYHYWVGRVHMSRYELDLAIGHFQDFLNTNEDMNITLRDETTYLLEWAQSAQESINHPNGFVEEQLPDGINSEYDDLSPVFFAGNNEILFMSNRNTSIDGDGKYHVFHGSKNEGEWLTDDPLNELGSFDFDNAKIEIIEDESAIAYIRENDGTNFYVSHFDDTEGWGDVKELNEQLSKSNIKSHFFINDHQDLIIFTQVNEGRSDLFQMDLNNGTWSEPYRVPGGVNSPNSDEIDPFMSYDRSTLYFSSNRDGTLGGYDIFMSNWNEETQAWGIPKNMGYPINSLDDEINFEVTPSHQSCYLASNRFHAMGGFDIYYFHEDTKIQVKGIVADQESGLPIPYAEVQFYPLGSDNEPSTVYADKDGNYETFISNQDEFRIVVASNQAQIHEQQYSSYVPTDAPFLTLDVAADINEAAENIASNADFSHAEVQLDASTDIVGAKMKSGEKVVLRNIYFDFESYEIVASADPILQRIFSSMQENPALQIEIAGHTDNIGSDEYNALLSQKRADAVMAHLVEHGVDAGRISARGYGDQFPLATNDDEKEGRELNRRIEVVALKEGNLDRSVVSSKDE